MAPVLFTFNIIPYLVLFLISRFKLMKWWAQSYLVGIPRIICGFRDDEGIVKNLQTFKTVEIPKETQVICTRARKLNFCCIHAICLCLLCWP